jgi:hypothetical protein
MEATANKLEQMSYISKMKAFLIACILLATIVFSPLSSCTARELAEQGEILFPSLTSEKQFILCV